MNKEIKAKWIEALRSGTYKQARGALHKDGSFCCLGVLCEILPTVVRVGNTYCDNTYAEARNLLHTEQTRKETGLDTDALRFCVEMNDIQEKSFEEIAAWIEAAL